MRIVPVRVQVLLLGAIDAGAAPERDDSALQPQLPRGRGRFYHDEVFEDDRGRAVRIDEPTRERHGRLPVPVQTGTKTVKYEKDC